MTLSLRRATASDLPAVTGILAARTAWLADRGHNQWSEKDPARATANTIAAGETWLMLADEQPVATMTMTTRADLDFWTPGELAQPALYLSKLATLPEAAGRELGADLVYAAYLYGAARGVGRLRWDVWRTNTQLQAYYTRLGARHIRTVEAPGRNSGALFEWAWQHVPTDRAADLAPLVEQAAPTTAVSTAPSARISLSQNLPSPGPRSWDPPLPDHWHSIHGLTAPNLYGDLRGTAEPISISPLAIGPLVYHAGDTWRAYGTFAHPADGKLLETLQPGHLYRLAHEVDACQVAVIGDADIAVPPALAATAAATPCSRPT